LSDQKFILYDFDGTIYDGDSSIDLYLFILKRYPKIIIYFPLQVISVILLKLRLQDDTKMKELFFSYLKSIDNIDKIISDFWVLNEWKIKGFYRNKDHSRDIIISASPEFLLDPIVSRYGVHKLISTIVDKINGKFISKNCYGKEKVNRLYTYNSSIEVEEFYTDDIIADRAVIDIAKKSFLVRKDIVEELKI